MDVDLVSAIEPMAGCNQAIKPSLSESIYERMRDLHIHEDANSHLHNIRAESSSKTNAQNFTPKASSASLRKNNQNNNDNEDKNFLDPRPVPETPRSEQQDVKQENTPSFSSIVRRVSLKGLNVLKTRRNSKSGDRPPSSFIPRPLLESSVHELEDTSSRQSSLKTQDSGQAPTTKIRGVSEAGSPFINHNKNAARVLSLKRTPAASPDLREAARAGTRQVSLPLPSNLFRRSSRLSSVKVFSESPSNNHHAIAQTDARTASTCTTIKHDPVSPVDEINSNPHKSDKENVTPKKHQHLTAEELSPIRNFKFPIVVPDEDTNQSPMSRITSTSNVTEAGTVYAEDDTGKYRVKPLSVSNPKQGPQLRIEASADHLLLNDQQLAEVEAKRAAYMHKYSAGSLKRKAENKKVVPELESLRLPNDGSMPSPPGNTTDSQPTSSKRRLAPPVPSDIGALKHSPIGWPLDVSKIAPFAEIEPSYGESSSTARKTASDSNLQAGPGTPNRQVNDGQESPSSAYTIRTALTKLPLDIEQAQSDPRPKAQKSLPEFGRPLFPPRTSSILDSPTEAQTSKGGLRKQTSGLLKSLTNQRAAFKHVTAQNDGHAHAHPAVVTPSHNAFTSSPKHMQSCNTSTRHVSTHHDVDSDQPSSPLALPGSVTASKPKMMSKVGSLLHKLSRDGDMLRHSSTRASLKHKPSIASPLSTSATTPDMVNRKDIARYMGVTEVPPSNRPTSMRSPMDLVKRDSLSQAAPALSTPPTAAAIYHGMVKETASKRKFPRIGHRHAQTHPPTPASSEPKPSSPKSFVTSALEPVEIREATTLAFSLLDRARDASPGNTSSSTSPTHIDDEETVGGSFSHGASQADYVELAKVIVNVVAMARETEKVAEEAKAAAAKAEIEGLKTRRAVAELCFTITRMIGEDRRVNRRQIANEYNN